MNLKSLMPGKIIKTFAILPFAILTVLNSSSQTSPVLHYLPDDARMIIKINSVSLRQKISWEDFSKEKIFEEIFKKMPESARSFVMNPRLTGIDFSKGIYLVMPQSKNNRKIDPAFYGIPGNAAEVDSMIKKIFPSLKPLKTENGKIIADKHTAIAWNSEIVILTGNDREVPDTTIAESEKLKRLVDRCKTLLQKRKTDFSNPSFISILKEEGDLLLWGNNTLPAYVKQANKTVDIMKAFHRGVMQNGDHITAVINFEQGKVVAKMKNYVSHSLDSMYKKYPVKNLNPETVKKLPEGDPLFICALSFSPDMINDMLAGSGMGKQMDSAIYEKLVKGNLIRAVKGDIMLAFLKSSGSFEDDSVSRAMNGLQLFVAGHIADKDKFRELTTLFRKQTPDSASGKKGHSKMKPSTLFNDSFFVLSFSGVAAQKFLDAPVNNSEMGKLVEPYKDHPFAVVMDMKTILGFAMQATSKGKQDDKTKQAMELIGRFDKLVGYGGAYDRDNSCATSNMELSFTDKDENSLKQFISFLSLIASAGKK